MLQKQVNDRESVSYEFNLYRKDSGQILAGNIKENSDSVEVLSELTNNQFDVYS